MEHKRALDQHHFAQVQLRTASQQWHRDHEQLLARALVTLEEARHAHQEELEHHRDRRHQREVCSQLREKVCVRVTLMTPTVFSLSELIRLKNYLTVVVVVASSSISSQQEVD